MTAVQSVDMEAYSRREPSFALCGLNCCLCPRFNADGASRCPGCGGPEFALKHPACRVITCAKKHGDIEYCFECGDYPCRRYEDIGAVDSFISYRNVKRNLGEAKEGLDAYLRGLRKRSAVLRSLLEGFNDGRSKNMYCLALELFPFPEIEAIEAKIAELEKSEGDSGARSASMKAFIASKAEELGIELKLRS